MIIKTTVNNKSLEKDVSPDMLLADFLRDNSFFSIKKGCETSNCGLCTVLLEGKPVLSCSVLAVRANNKSIVTLEGLSEEEKKFGELMAKTGSEQCGFCNTGFIMNVVAMKKELKNPTEDEIKEYLVGNLCRCSGYMGHMGAILEYIKEA